MSNCVAVWNDFSVMRCWVSDRVMNKESGCWEWRSCNDSFGSVVGFLPDSVEFESNNADNNFAVAL